MRPPSVPLHSLPPLLPQHILNLPLPSLLVLHTLLLCPCHAPSSLPRPFVLPAPCPSAACCHCCLRLPSARRAFHSLHLHGGNLISPLHCFHGDLTCAIVPEAASRHVPISKGSARDPLSSLLLGPPLSSASPWQRHACSGAGAPGTLPLDMAVDVSSLPQTSRTPFEDTLALWLLGPSGGWGPLGSPV